MSYRRYKLNELATEIGPAVHVAKAAMESLILEVFERFSEEQSSVDTPNSQQALRAKVMRRPEGRGKAHVYELTFSPSAGGRPVGRFIVRCHSGTDSTADYEREVRLVRHLRGRDCFSATLYEPIGSVPATVVYRHADDEFCSTSVHLHEAILRALSSRDDAEVGRLADAVGNLARACIDGYHEFASPVVWPRERYLETVAGRLCPNLLISRPGRSAEVVGSMIRVPNSEGEVVSNAGAPDAQGLRWLLDSVLATVPSPGRWVRACGRVENAKGDDLRNLKLVGDGVSLWLQVDPTSLRGYDLHGKDVEVLLKLEDDEDPRPSSRLEQLGVPQEAFISREELSQIIDRLPEEIILGLRHTDLHCGNVLYSGGRAKVVDLGSGDYDLYSVSQSRIEVSILWQVLREVDFDRDEIRSILGSLARGVELDEQAVSWRARALGMVLLSLRRGFAAASVRPTAIDLALGYATQVLIFQRYCLEQDITVPDSLGVVFRHWVRQLQDHVYSGETVPLATPTPSIEPAAETVTSGLTVHDLWYQALCGATSYSARATELHNALRAKQIMQRRLTGLQKVIYDRCAVEDPFRSDRNVLISGPTSSGKSTVAQAFLAVPPLLNQQRRCALYIAPTRALTQAFYRELKALFDGDAEMCEGIHLSTGEDTDSDWDINHGRFSIACMVYEKANMLFSQNKSLLDLLGCVVVDETHMLSNLDRGPILELALTKIMWHRATRAGSAREEALRIVAISTEDRPDASFRSFLTVPDPNTGRDSEPIILQDGARPVPVRHILVLPGSSGVKYEPFPFVEFEGSGQRQLSNAEVKDLHARILDVCRAGPGSGQHRGAGKPFAEMRSRLRHLLLDLLEERPYGYRVLVFVPSRADAEETAKHLSRERVKRSHGSSSAVAANLAHRALCDQLQPSLEASENERLKACIEECARAGVLVHHADVDRKTRTAIEGICATMEPHIASQVIFATGTLSYGVNLAVHDVVLLGTEVHSQTRLDRKHVTEPLQICEFHNMVGRAGRLGKIGSSRADVYIMCPVDEGIAGNNACGVIRDYYTRIRSVESTLYDSEDRRVEQDVESHRLRSLSTLLKGSDEVRMGDPRFGELCVDYMTLGAADFSYPLVRGILDALRHLNILASEGGSGRTPVPIESVLALLDKSLYSVQWFSDRDVKDEHRRFVCAVWRILSDCAKLPLGLVSMTSTEGKWPYAITPRGEAVIDTGTEILTVESLLTVVQEAHKRWRDVVDVDPPVELYVLCILAQTEVFRRYIRYAPECKGRDAQKIWPDELARDNREHVVQALARSLQLLEGVTDSEATSLATSLRAMLDGWQPLYQVGGGYLGAPSDSILRYFTGLIAWVKGHDFRLIEAGIEGRELPEGFASRLEAFKQLTEVMNWKTLFLARMLSSSQADGVVLTPDREHALLLLSSRLRLGCVPEAVPLFWPFSSDVRRQEAQKLLDAGISPRRLLSMANPVQLAKSATDIPPKKIRDLLRDLERYCANELKELQGEMLASKGDDPRRVAAYNLWSGLLDIFAEGMKHFRGAGGSHVDFDAFIRETLDLSGLDPIGTSGRSRYLGSSARASLDERYRSRLEIPASEGIALIGERRESSPPSGAAASDAPKFVTDRSISVHGLQFHGDWTCHVAAGVWMGFADHLSKHEAVRHLVIVALPWLPSTAEMPDEVREILQLRNKKHGFSTTMVTPAAFGVMLSLIARDWIPSELCIKALSEQARPPHLFNEITIRTVRQIADSVQDRQVAAQIRECMIKHFEVHALGLPSHT